MIKTMVKWGWTDDYDYVKSYSIKWFQNREKADKWIYNMEEENGGYFKVKEIKEADHEKWLKLIELKKEVKKLEKEF